MATSEASYVIASSDKTIQRGLRNLIEGIANTMVSEFGALLLLEVWAGDIAGESKLITSARSHPFFRIIVPRGGVLGSFVHVLAGALKKITVARQPAEVEIVRSPTWSAKLPPVLPAAAASRMQCSVFGLEIRPVYRHPKTGEIYPVVMRELRRGLTRALRRAFHEFARVHTTHRPKHFHTLGRRAVVKAVWDVDAKMAEVSDSFDFLLQVTPVNAEEAWNEFQRSGFEKRPRFHYRPVPMEPAILKRKLYAAPIERIEDPALADLFRQKQDELDRRITMLGDINTGRFAHGSVQLFGNVSDELAGLAARLLERLPPRSRDDSKQGQLRAEAFAERARAEIEHYRRLHPDVRARVEIRDDIASGSMVSRGSLLVGKRTSVPASRVEALLHHEVGTHVLTYYNGRSQPLRQLYSGLAGYEALQEGLAVLSEYLVGGLSRPRLRLLAARVLAVRYLIDGASFIETFRKLTQAHGFGRRMAFTITMRVYRGGGLTKDAVYLRGLDDLLAYLEDGGDLEVLFTGKFAAQHVPIIKELLWRRVLHQAPLRPRYLDLPETQGRLERARAGLSLMQLVGGDRR